MYEGLVNDLLDAAKVDKGTSISKLLERAAEAIERLEERVAIMMEGNNAYDTETTNEGDVP